MTSCSLLQRPRALGVRKGDIVATLTGNKPEWIIANLAICSLGAIMVALNSWVTTRVGMLAQRLHHVAAITRTPTRTAPPSMRTGYFIIGLTKK
jgi:acyl-coenzyme A synthetase/AMP-(fatty) acid ligase